MSDKETNPFLTLWNILGTIGGITSLSSMVQTWFDDLFAWAGFISTIIESYRSLIEPVMTFLFGWLPFAVPLWVGDYLVLGGIVAGAMAKADPGFRTPRGILGPLLFWPLLIAVTLLLTFPRSQSIVADNRDFRIHDRFFIWVATVVLGFVVLLAINAQL